MSHQQQVGADGDEQLLGDEQVQPAGALPSDGPPLKRIVVIGGGLAGSGAASHLASSPGSVCRFGFQNHLWTTIGFQPR